MKEDLVRVFSTPSAIEGQLVKGRLEAEGIPVLLKGEGEGPYRMGPADIYVPSSYEPHARLVLESTVEPNPGEDGAADEDGPADEPVDADTPSD